MILGEIIMRRMTFGAVHVYLSFGNLFRHVLAFLFALGLASTLPQLSIDGNYLGIEKVDI